MQKRALSLLAACGLFQVAMGIYFIVLRPAMLAEDERFTGLSLEDNANLPAIPIWLDRVFAALGAAGAGLLILLAATLLWSRPTSLTALMLIVAGAGRPRFS